MRRFLVSVLALGTLVLISGRLPAATPDDELTVGLCSATSADSGVVSYEPCCCDACSDTTWHLLPQCGRLTISGWIDAGFVGNTSSPDSRFNGPYDVVERSNEPMLNQIYLVSEIGLPSDGSCGIGARLDVLYGEDYLVGQSTGFESRPDNSPRWNSREYYGISSPQSYIVMGTQDLSLKVGHFYTTVGFESLMVPNNFFYTQAYSYQVGGPATHWGGLLNWTISDSLQTHVGLHNGWDAFDRVSDSPSVIAGVKYTDTCRGWWTSFAITSGQEFNRYGAGQFTNLTRYSWLVMLPLTQRLDYVFHHWLGFQEDASLSGERGDWYGIDQYLTYAINDCWKAGMRLEWFRDEEGTRIGLNRPSNPNKTPFVGNFFAVSAGLNWKPCPNVVVRPEVRWDWFDGDQARLPYADGRKDNQLLLSADAIVHF